MQKLKGRIKSAAIFAGARAHVTVQRKAGSKWQPSSCTPEVVPELLQVFGLQRKVQLLVQRHAKHAHAVLEPEIAQRWYSRC